MCGIVGVACTQAVRDKGWIDAATASLRHRGPDDGGGWWAPDDRIGFGHRRLSIVDLTPAGHQPMLDVANDLAIVFNGEIYGFRVLRTELVARGHVFATSSDTEVILAAYREWGTSCVERLDGMFAFAIADLRRGTVFLARDRAGEKPLLYAASAGSLRFASELKALLADPGFPRVVDLTALNHFLAQGFVPGSSSILSGVSKLPPGHAFEFDLATGRGRRWRYWALPPFADDGAAADELVDALERLLEQAVRSQLVADVPVGVLLSGGVDSSLVTALAARAVEQVKTFTVRFPGHARFDETPHARLIARHFGTEHSELEAGEVEPELLSTLAQQFDEPLIDSSMLPTHLVSVLVRRHCKVVLGGDGGDELFGGYSHYDRLLKLQRFAGWLPLPVRKAAAELTGALAPVGMKGRNWLQGLGTDLDNRVPMIASYFDDATRRALLGARALRVSAADEAVSGQGVVQGDLLERATRLDFATYLPEDILVKTDRASMLSSLEVRAPFLDRRVIEFAFARVPSSLKATSDSRKILLKRLAARVLPPTFDFARKQGFSIPLDEWLRAGKWPRFFADVLLGERQTTFDHGLVRRLLDSLGRGRGNGERLFGLLMFELWRAHYRVELPDCAS
jgi:asparagine synthase (glutamine-hydrolysing)